jgi:translation initiation factor IF-2
MDDNNKEQKKSTLTLNPSKLKPSKPVGSGQTMHLGRRQVTVVVKKERNFALPKDNQDKKPLPAQTQAIAPQTIEGEKSALSISEEEKNTKLQLLKQAADQEAIALQQEVKKQEKEKLLREKIEAEVAVAVEETPKTIIEEDTQVKKENSVEEKVNIANANLVETQTESQAIKEKDVNPTSKTIYEEEGKAKSSLKGKVSVEEGKVGKHDVKSSKGRWGEDTRRASSKINIHLALEGMDEERGRSLSSIRRARAKARRHGNNDRDANEKIVREVILPEAITVQELANRMAERGADVIRELMKLGMLVTASQSIDADTAELVIQAFGHKTKRVAESDVESMLLDTDQDDDASQAVKRAPVVTVMGHVDHGKTSLLDALRSADVAGGEAGGITQHIGAYQVHLPNGEAVTFLDTPGHEAFTAMRSRGAKATDIVVLVVAADDGIMAQTIEAINHAKAAEVPIIVAINKIDKPDANPDRVRNELLSHELVAEELGGDIMVVEVSAKNRINLDKLIDGILLQAEMLELKANSNRPAVGVVIEAKMDKNRGVVATLLVQKGTLSVGSIVVAGGAYGKIKAIYDDKGVIIDKALPSMPVEILGLNEVPEAGDKFAMVLTEKQARDISEFRLRKARELRTMAHRGNLEELFSRTSEGKIKELPIIIKGDVQGSVEAIVASLQKLTHEEVKLRILHSAVGGINESDIALAGASKAMIIGFNVRANVQAREVAAREGIDIRYYSIIYNLIDDIKGALSGMLSPILREQYLGSAEIRQVFNITKIGKVGGCFVVDGIIKRGAKVRLLRDNIVIHEGKLKTLRRFKEDAKEVKEGFECGMAFENYDDIREKDFIEAFEIIEEKQVLQ